MLIKKEDMAENLEEYEAQMKDLNKQTGTTIAASTASMAAAGATLGPWGAVGGAAVGATIGVVQAKENKKAYMQNLADSQLALNAVKTQQARAIEQQKNEEKAADKMTTMYIGGRSKPPVQEPTSTLAKKGMVKKLNPIGSSVSPLKMKASEAEKIRKFNSISHKLPEMNAGDSVL